MNKVNFIPNGERVLVEQAKAETKTASGIIIPDKAQDKPLRGVVMATVSGDTDFNVGDKIYYQRFRGQEITLAEGSTFLCLEKDDILGKIGNE